MFFLRFRLSSRPRRVIGYRVSLKIATAGTRAPLRIRAFPFERTEEGSEATLCAALHPRFAGDVARPLLSLKFPTAPDTIVINPARAKYGR